MFAYPDAARYRLGTNYQQLRCNYPHSKVYQPFERDGQMSTKGNCDGDPNYINSQVIPLRTRTLPEETNVHDHWVGKVTAFATEVTDDDFVQARDFWYRVLPREPGQQENFVSNVAESLTWVTVAEVRKRSFGGFFFFFSFHFPFLFFFFFFGLWVRADLWGVDVEMFARVDSDLAVRIEEQVKKTDEARRTGGTP